MRKLLLLMVLLCSPLFATVTTTHFNVSYTCTGTTGPFAFNFPISTPAALNVIMNGVVQPSTNYIIIPVNNNYNNGGSVTMVATQPCQTGWTMVLTRNTPVTQTTQYYDNMPIPMSTMESSLDKLTEIAQEINTGKTTIQMQNNGLNYLLPQGGSMIFNFANCVVSGPQGNFTITCSSGGGTGGSSGLGTVVPSGSTVQSTINSVKSTGFGAPVVVPQGYMGNQTFTNPVPPVPVLNYTPSPNGDYDKNGVQPVDIFGVKHDGQVVSCSMTGGNPQITCSGANFTSADVGKLVLIYTNGPAGTSHNGIIAGPFTASGGAGGTSGTQSLVSTNGGCTYPMRGWVTVSGGSVSGPVTVWQYGWGCTSVPTTASVMSVTGPVTLSGGQFGNVDLPTTIVSVQSSTAVTLADAVANSTTDNILYGTDDYLALTAACNGHGLSQNGGHYTHVGISMISQGVVCNGNNTWIQGAGWAPLVNSGGGSAIVYAGRNPSGTDGIWISSAGYGAKLTDMGLKGNSWALPRGLVISEGVHGGNGNSAIGWYDHLWIGAMWGDGIGTSVSVAQLSEGIFADVATGNGDFNMFGQIYIRNVVHGLDGNNDQAVNWDFRQLQVEDSYVGLCSFAGGFHFSQYYTEGNNLDILTQPCVPGAGVGTNLTIDNYGGESSAQNIKYGTLGVAPNVVDLIINSGGFGQPPYIEDPSQIVVDLGTGGSINNGVFVLGAYPNGFIGINTTGGETAKIVLPYFGCGGYGPYIALNTNLPPSNIITLPNYSAPSDVCFNNPGNLIWVNGSKMIIGQADYKANQVNPIPNLQNDFLGTVNDYGTMHVKSIRPPGQTDLFPPAVPLYGVSVTQNGITGSTTYNYELTCSDSAGNETAPAPTVTGGTTPAVFSISNGNATLSAANYITVSIVNYTRRGCSFYNLYGNEGSGAIGYLTSIDHVQFDIQGSSFYDQGLYTKNTSRVPPAITQSGALTVEGPATLARVNGAVYVDGLTYTTVQAAINALPSNGGTVIVPCGAYTGPTSIPSGTHLKSECPLPSSLEGILDSAAVLNTTRFVYTSSQTFANVRDIALDGITFDFGNTGGLVLDGVGWSHFDMAVINCASSAPCLTLQATTVNTSANDFARLYTFGGSESLKLSGNAAATHFVTDNHFYTMFLASPNNGSGTGTFIDFARWCDSNEFNFVNLFNVNVGASTVVTGVIFNSDAPTSERGVYNETFQHIDFNSGAITVASSNLFQFNLAHSIYALVGVAQPLVDANGTPKITYNSACTSVANCDLTLVSEENGDAYRGLSVVRAGVSVGGVNLAPGGPPQYTMVLPTAQPTTGNTYLSCSAANPAICSWVAGGTGGPGGGGFTNTTVYKSAGSATNYTLLASDFSSPTAQLQTIALDPTATGQVTFTTPPSTSMPGLGSCVKLKNSNITYLLQIVNGTGVTGATLTLSSNATMMLCQDTSTSFSILDATRMNPSLIGQQLACPDSTSTDTYTCSTPNTWQFNFSASSMVSLVPTHANTCSTIGGCTLYVANNPGNASPKNIVKAGPGGAAQALAPGDIVANGASFLIFNGTTQQWFLANPGTALSVPAGFVSGDLMTVTSGAVTDSGVANPSSGVLSGNCYQTPGINCPGTGSLALAQGASNPGGQLGVLVCGAKTTAPFYMCTQNNSTVLSAEYYFGPTPSTAGDIKYFNGTDWTILAGNNTGTKVLQETATGVPSWVTVSGGGNTITSPNGTIAVGGTSTASTLDLASAHSAASVAACSDTSGSGTAQTCNTSPTFTPVAGDCIIYTTTTANTGAGLTINVNSLGAKSVAKWQTTTSLAAGDLAASTRSIMCYDGTNWEMGAIGNPPSSGGGTPLYSLVQTNVSIPTTTTLATLTGTGCASNICTMTTPSVDGTYRLTWQLTQTAAGVGSCTTGSVQFLLYYTGADNAWVYNATLQNAFTRQTTPTVTQSMAINANSPGPGTDWVAIPIEFRAKGGVAIRYSINASVAGNCATTQATFNVRPALYGPLGY